MRKLILAFLLLAPAVFAQTVPVTIGNNYPMSSAGVSAIEDKIGNTRGSIQYRGATGWAALPPSTSGYVLTSNGPGADPSYQAPTGGSITNKIFGQIALSSTIAASTTNYVCPGQAGSATEATRQMVTPVAGTVKSLYIKTNSTQASSGSLTVTLRVNGADTAITYVLAASTAAGTFSDTAHSVTVNAGDNWDISLVNAGTSVSANITSIALSFQ